MFIFLLINFFAAKKENQDANKILTDIEQSILQKQLKQICTELETKNIEIEKLQKNIEGLQILHAERMYLLTLIFFSILG